MNRPTKRWRRVLHGVLQGLTMGSAAAALLLVPLGGSSTSSEIRPNPYLPRSAHQAYGYSLARIGFERPSPRRDWLLASERALTEPVDVAVPFTSAGEFDPEGAEAPSYRFKARAGRRMYIEIRSEAAESTGRAPTARPPEVFVDLFVVGANGVEHVQSAPPAPNRESSAARQRLELAVLEPGDYVVRVQPELGYSGVYEVSVRSEPLLLFPVQGADTRAIQSGFGAERDAGARSHRGVDIFVPRGTPALAAMDGWVTRVETTPRGGNVVWLRPLFGNMRLYYAHLDTQLVSDGDFVLAGDVLGTVGNTGNARTTPPHLHFGVYIRDRGRRGGARDPQPFLVSN